MEQHNDAKLIDLIETLAECQKTLSVNVHCAGPRSLSD
jgi:hypothetical protein